MSSRSIIIAIDGPSGAGKGTVARTLAERLGFIHVDTGAMYRAVAWKAGHAGLDLADEDAVTAVADAAEFELGATIRVDGHDITRAIRTPEMDAAAAIVARHPKVRQSLVRRQRDYAEQGGLVMEGRDIGTVVFPDADVKVFLDASAEERARRRAHDTSHASSESGQVEQVASALAQRDHADSTRKTSPLTMAADAVRIDTTGVSVHDVVQRVIRLIEQISEQKS
ncbi:MAG: (d)CMP kinase [Acidobacteriota bacterium]|nr:(d)CMP kinase [Acidobacteriota bacterium]